MEIKKPEYVTKDRVGIGTIQELVERSLVEFPTKTALKKRNPDGSYFTMTYSELGSAIHSVSSYLNWRRVGQRKNIGDRVALLSENRPEWTIAYYGIINSGATIVPIDKELSREQIERILQHSEAKAVIVSEKEAEKIRRSRAALSNLETVVVIGNTEENEIKFNGLLEYKKEPKVRVPQEQVATIVYTSGTTGVPKGVMLTHYNLIYDITAALQMMDADENDRFISLLPPNHTYDSAGNTLCPMLTGATLIYGGDLKSKEDTRVLPMLLKETKPTIFLGVPLLYENIYNNIILNGLLHRQIEYEHITGLPYPVNSSNALLYSHRVPWEIIIDEYV